MLKIDQTWYMHLTTQCMFRKEYLSWLSGGLYKHTFQTHPLDAYQALYETGMDVAVAFSVYILLQSML